MAYTETKVTGYGTRVKNSCAGIGFGILMFIIGTCLLWWNERRAVRTGDMLDEVAEVCQVMDNPSKVDPNFDGELVCTSGLATTEDVLTDDKFGFSEKAIGLSRKVEYYQWVEHEHHQKKDKFGGSEEDVITYDCTKSWTSSPVSSDSFHEKNSTKYKNFVLTEVDEANIWASNVSFGAYKLSEELIHRISSREDLNLAINEDLLRQFDKSTQVAYERFYGVKKPAQPVQPVQQPTPQPAVSDSTNVVADSIKAVADSIQAVTDSILKNAENKKDLEYVHQAGNMLYFGRVPGSPEVGDVRITFEKVVPAKVTIAGRISGDTFVNYVAKNGETFLKLYMGKKTKEEVVQTEKDNNKFLTWALRILGALLIIGGLKNIFGFIETILKVVPFISNIVGFGVGIICTILGIVWSIIVIAIAWIFYRPLLGIALLVIAGLLIWIFAFKGKAKLQELASKAKNKVSEAKAPAPENA